MINKANKSEDYYKTMQEIFQKKSKTSYMNETKSFVHQ